MGINANETREIISLNKDSLTEENIKLIFNVTSKLVKENFARNLEKEIENFNKGTSEFQLISREEGYVGRQDEGKAGFRSLDSMRYLASGKGFPEINSAANILGAYGFEKPQHATFVFAKKRTEDEPETLDEPNKYNLQRKLLELTSSQTNPKLVKCNNALQTVTFVEGSFAGGEDSDKIKYLYYFPGNDINKDPIYLKPDQLEGMAVKEKLYTALGKIYYRNNKQSFQSNSKIFDKAHKEALVSYGLTPEVIIYKKENHDTTAKSIAEGLFKERRGAILALTEKGYFNDFLTSKEIEEAINKPIIITKATGKTLAISDTYSSKEVVSKEQIENCMKKSTKSIAILNVGDDAEAQPRLQMTENSPSKAKPLTQYSKENCFGPTFKLL